MAFFIVGLGLILVAVGFAAYDALVDVFSNKVA